MQDALRTRERTSTRGLTLLGQVTALSAQVMHLDPVTRTKYFIEKGDSPYGSHSHLFVFTLGSEYSNYILY